MHREGRLCGGQGHCGTRRSRQGAEAREGPLALGGHPSYSSVVGTPSTDPHGEGGWVVTPDHRRVTSAAAAQSPLSRGPGRLGCSPGA